MRYIDNPIYRDANFAARMEQPPPGLQQLSPQHYDVDNVNQYHQCRLCEYSILTPEQEKHLFQQLNFFRMVATEKLADDVLAATKKAQTAANTLLAHNLRLIVNFLGKHGKNITERIGDGTAIIQRAINSFDWAKGNKFSTYAIISLQKALGRELRSDTVTNLVRNRGNVTVFSEFRPPTTWPDSRSEFVDETLCITTKGGNDVVDNKDLLETLWLAMDPRASLAVRLHYYSHLTYKEVGTEMKVSAERVKQLIARGLKKMKILAMKKYSRLF